MKNLPDEQIVRRINMNREDFASRLNSAKRKVLAIQLSVAAIGFATFLALLSTKPGIELLGDFKSWAETVYIVLICVLLMGGISLGGAIEERFLVRRGVSCPHCRKSIPVHLGRAVIANGYCPNCGKEMFAEAPNKPVHSIADAPAD